MVRKSLMGVAVAVIVLLLVPCAMFAADKLAVKDTTGNNTVFVVTDQLNQATGTVGIGTASPASALHVEGTVRPQFIVANSQGNARMDFLRGSASGVSQLLFGTGAPPSQVLDFQMGMFLDNRFQIRLVNQESKGITIAPNTGYVGVGTASPAHLFQAGSAYTDGNVWTNASSREYKDNIRDLSGEEAVQALQELNPVTFMYKTDPAQQHVGFIAEDAPALVSTKDRKGLSAMDIVAVLTKVVKDQNETIQAMTEKMGKLEREITRLKSKDMVGAVQQ